MRASDKAYVALLEDIQSGAIAPGTVIGEVEQSERFGVSRTPMREALGRLMADGLVRQQSPRVLVVAEFDADQIRDLFEARQALEVMTARVAAIRGDRDVFRGLAAEFAAAQPEQNELAANEYFSLIARFDAAVDAAANNPYLTAAVRPIRAHLVRARRLARDNRARIRASVGEHVLIATAIADGDAELAAHATHIHLHNALTSILSSLGSSTKEGPQ